MPLAVFGAFDAILGVAWGAVSGAAPALSLVLSLVPFFLLEGCTWPGLSVSLLASFIFLGQNRVK